MKSMVISLMLSLPLLEGRSVPLQEIQGILLGLGMGFDRSSKQGVVEMIFSTVTWGAFSNYMSSQSCLLQGTPPHQWQSQPLIPSRTGLLLSAFDYSKDVLAPFPAFQRYSTWMLLLPFMQVEYHSNGHNIAGIYLLISYTA